MPIEDGDLNRENIVAFLGSAIAALNREYNNPRADDGIAPREHVARLCADKDGEQSEILKDVIDDIINNNNAAQYSLHTQQAILLKHLIVDFEKINTLATENQIIYDKLKKYVTTTDDAKSRETFDKELDTYKAKLVENLKTLEDMLQEIADKNQQILANWGDEEYFPTIKRSVVPELVALMPNFATCQEQIATLIAAIREHDAITVSVALHEYESSVNRAIAFACLGTLSWGSIALGVAAVITGGLFATNPFGIACLASASLVFLITFIYTEVSDPELVAHGHWAGVAIASFVSVFAPIRAGLAIYKGIKKKKQHKILAKKYEQTKQTADHTIENNLDAMKRDAGLKILDDDDANPPASPNNPTT